MQHTVDKTVRRTTPKRRAAWLRAVARPCSASHGKHGRAGPAVAHGVAIGLLIATLAAGGCSRLSIVDGRLGAIADEQARTVLLDALWAHGSTYRWVEHSNLRAEVAWIEHSPLGDRTTEMVWLFDPWGDRVRVERLPERTVALATGRGLEVFADGKETADPVLRARAAGDVRIVRQLAPMPFSLTEDGVSVAWAGTRTGPGEARVWQRLRVTWRGAGDFGQEDRTVVEIRKDTRRVAGVDIQWPEFPLADRPMRVEMVEWWEASGLALSRLWRFVPLDESGKVAGPPMYTVRVKRLEFDAKATAEVFQKP